MEKGEGTGSVTAASYTDCLSRSLTTPVRHPDVGAGGTASDVRSQQLQYRTGLGRRRPVDSGCSIAPFALDEPERNPLPQRAVLRRHPTEGMQRNMCDQINFTENDYPDPPPVGVRVPLRHEKRCRTILKPERVSTCFDDDCLRRARARCPQSAQQRMPSFIFGEDAEVQRRTGRAIHAKSYKPTSLW
uniref:Uncharacterized protein n=1 Tax=Trypanosoma congolense (strain IL3000) TaxID=1068625 RepID=G0UVQ3_TRYCI|nr:conserved hypothetical protein [Trypanosoma congolense IL3000]